MRPGAVWYPDPGTADFRHLLVCTLVLSLMKMSDAFVYRVPRQVHFAAASIRCCTR